MGPVIELSVIPRAGEDQRLLGFAFQQPPRSGEISNYALEIVGWAVGRDAAVDRIELVRDGRVIRTAAVDGSRPVVGSRFPTLAWAATSGFAFMLNSLAFEPEFEFELRAVIDGQGMIPLATIRGRRQSLPPADASKLQPIIVTSLGRTGTTWTMRLLAEHPAIVAYRRYPYEVRPAMYWLHLLRVLTSPADYGKQVSHPHGFYADDTMVGANPFFASNLADYPALQEWSGHTYVEKLTGFVQDSIEGWYRQLAAQQNQPEPAYFVEKYLPNQFPLLMWELYPRAREIFLVRDPRDVASSVLAFNAKRGFADFGRQHAESDEAYLHQLLHGMTSLLTNWRQRAATGHLVRYEDLITTPQETLATIFTYLDLDASPATVAAIVERASHKTPELQRHQTSESPAASIGRWRRDLDPAMQAKANELFSDVLDSFGYEMKG